MHQYSRPTDPARNLGRKIISLELYRHHRRRTAAHIRARAVDLSLSIRLRPGAPLPPWDRELSLALDRWILAREVRS